jgi:hypothetical protein
LKPKRNNKRLFFPLRQPAHTNRTQKPKAQRRHLFDSFLFFFKGSHGLGEEPRLDFFSAEGKEKRIIMSLEFDLLIKFPLDKLINNLFLTK